MDKKKDGCFNYESLCPEGYKLGAIKTLLHRGYYILKDWKIFHLEFELIKQLLTNNFPIKLIDETMSKVFRSKFKMKNNSNGTIEMR